MTDSINKSTIPAYNSSFAIGGASCFADSFWVAESFMPKINICSELSALRKSVNRYLPF